MVMKVIKECVNQRSQQMRGGGGRVRGGWGGGKGDIKSNCSGTVMAVVRTPLRL